MGQSGVILLDTHALLWLISEPARLSQSATAVIEQARAQQQGLAIVDISLLEIATLVKKGRVGIQIDLETVLDVVQSRFVVKAITSRACLKTLELPANYPKDPADRIIGATALADGIPLLTADENIRKAKAFATIW